MYKDFLKTFHISHFQLKVFSIAFLAMFIMVLLEHLGVHSPLTPVKPVIPRIEKKMEISDPIRSKLEQKKNTFQLKKESPSSLIQQARATSIVDNAASYALVDLDTGQLLAGKNSDQAMPVASITKVMTAIVALDLADPSELFTITPHAADAPPTKIVIVPGEKMTLEELLNASLLTSANDATEQIRDGINTKYQNEIFVAAMNKKASFLGLKNTHFNNPQGFDEDNYSSSEDLAIIISYALAQYPLIADIVKKDFQQLPPNQNHKQFDLYNWNGLIGVYPETQGMKIGNTDAAGYTTSVVSQRGGKKMLAIVLGAPGVMERDLWAAELLDQGYSQTLGLPPVSITEDMLQQKYDTWEYGN